MNSTRLPLPVACVALVFAAHVALAQIAPAPSPTTAATAAKEDAVQLSPFQVIAEDDRSYQAANTLGATRTNVAIRDLPMQMYVVTEQLMVDRDSFAQPRQFVGSVGVEF